MGSQFENAAHLIKFLEARRYPASASSIMQEHEWSRPTFYRALQSAKEQGHQIKCLRGQGYRLIPNENVAALKGFSHKELECLAVVWQMLENTQNEWIQQYADLRSNILLRLRSQGIPIEQWEGRVKYLPQHRRRTPAGVFQKVSNALLHRKVVQFRFQRADDVYETREVHPQQLILYRNGWSLDALDENRRNESDHGLRQFSLDLISHVREVNKSWVDVPKKQLEDVFASGYGLYAGKSDATAKIKFIGKAAFYAKRDIWHTKQTMQENNDGSVELSLPYVSSHPDELLGDILRWGELAMVLEPTELKQQWKKKIEGMWKSLKI